MIRCEQLQKGWHSSKICRYHIKNYICNTFNPIYVKVNYKSSCFRLLMMYYNVRLVLLTHCHKSHALFFPFSYILFSSEKSTMDTSCHAPYSLIEKNISIIRQHYTKDLMYLSYDQIKDLKAPCSKLENSFSYGR